MSGRRKREQVGLPALGGPLLAWYEAAARDLPWRAPGASPWAVLVSEVMLQQTPVARVLPSYTAWLARWPTPAALAEDSAGEAIRQWNRLGYPRRALRLHAAAATIVVRHDGQVPSDLADLLALPGVGEYTARAVASFAFGQRQAVVDTNVRRVLARALRGGHAPGTAAAADLRLIEALLPADPALAARVCVALMELGALVCTARAPRCGGCPLRPACRWASLGGSAPADRPSRGQPYAGTDRQARGELLRMLRGHADAVSLAALLAAWPTRFKASARWAPYWRTDSPSASPTALSGCPDERRDRPRTSAGPASPWCPPSPPVARPAPWAWAHRGR